ncbi:MAG: hypothetical protein LBS73_06140 [Campylobacteraceae bacterium]|jgi:hypothetical protein|nr:hypothetical protein [Campylobacteraceae bacterium]
MGKKLLLALLVVVGGLFYAGCSTTSQPVYNIEGAHAQSFDGKALTSAQVEKAILSAGTQRGWRMQKVKDGLITATYYARQHMAQIEVKYSSSSYSIKYKNSSDLNYDGVNIHRNYNSWIRNLDNSIQLYLNN